MAVLGQEQHEHDVPHGNIHIFVAEDNDADASLVQLALRTHGIAYALWRAVDGEKAVEMIRSLGQPEGMP